MTRLIRLTMSLLAAVALSGSLAAAAHGTAVAGPGPCGQAISGQPQVTHIIIVMMENRSYGSVIGNSSAPYENTLASECGNAANAWGATHWSQANYTATAAGAYTTAQESGCASNNGYTSACVSSSSNIFNELDQSGDATWAAYEESMPANCDGSDTYYPHSRVAKYKTGHNPAIWFTDIAPAQYGGDNSCAVDDVGVSNLTAKSGAFYDALQAGTLPDVSWITPNTKDDGDACPPSTPRCNHLRDGDTWLQGLMNIITASSEYTDGSTVVLVTYDEGTGKDASPGEDCANQSLDGGQPSCSVPLFVVYPYTAPVQDTSFFTHYSITEMVDDCFGLQDLAPDGTTALDGFFNVNAGCAAAGP